MISEARNDDDDTTPTWIGLRNSVNNGYGAPQEWQWVENDQDVDWVSWKADIE